MIVVTSYNLFILMNPSVLDSYYIIIFILWNTIVFSIPKSLVSSV